MPLAIELDRTNSQPLYQQIVTQIKHWISVGTLPTGTRLPPVRQLAEELGVTRLTVHNAYMELQMDGWVEATVGRGTFVSAVPHSVEIINRFQQDGNPDHLLDHIYEMNQIMTLRSLAYALPDSELMPVTEILGIIHSLRKEAPSLMQYSTPIADASLRVELVKLLEERGVDVLPDEILVTNGATQGIALIAQALARPGDCVLVEQPTYHGQFKIFSMIGAQPIGIPLDDEGPRLDVLERIMVQQRPRFFYTIPNFHNPTGQVMSMQRRIDLLALAARHRLLIVEDDVYGFLSYDNPPLPALKSLDKSDQVVLISGLSKILIPGLRVGFLVAPEPLHSQLVNLKWAFDLGGPLLMQRALAEFLQRGWFKTHMRRVIPAYKERRDVLMQALQRWMPSGVSWTHPKGGFCCWVKLPVGYRSTELYTAALQRGVAITPGEAFMYEPDAAYHFRICFGNSTPAILQESVRILGELVTERVYQHEYIRNPRALASQWTPLV